MKLARATLLALVMVGGALPAASAQPYPPPVVVGAPPGWVGPHYYWRHRHWHHRAWAFDRFHHRYWRYY